MTCTLDNEYVVNRISRYVVVLNALNAALMVIYLELSKTETGPERNHADSVSALETWDHKQKSIRK